MFDVSWRVAAGIQTPAGIQRHGLSAVQATTVTEAMSELRALVAPRFGIASTERQIEITACTETPSAVAKDILDDAAKRTKANALLKQYGDKK